MITSSLMSSNSREWETPQEFFDKLDAEFHFELDPCATSANAKCRVYYTKETDGLSKDWARYEGAVFVNPPYGREIGEWVRKAYKEAREYRATVVMLLPARTDTRWWHRWVMKAYEIRFVQGRLYFTDSDGKTGRAPFPSAVVVFRPWHSSTVCVSSMEK